MPIYDLPTLADQIPLVADEAARSLIFPSPEANQRVQNLAKQVNERYDAVAGAWIVDFPGYAILPGELGVTNPRWPVGDVRRYGADTSGVTYSLTAFRAAYAARELFKCVVYIPAGDYKLNGTTRARVSGHHTVTGGARNTRFHFSPSPTEFTVGLGMVKGDILGGQLTAQFLLRDQIQRLYKGDRIVVGANHYVLTGDPLDITNPRSPIWPPANYPGVTVSRVGNLATFSASMAGQIMNGSNLSIDAGYTVSAFNGTNQATLTLTATGGNATFANGSSFIVNRHTASIAPCQGTAGTAFAAATFVRPDVAVFEYALANPGIISNCTTPAGTFIADDTVNQKIAIDLRDQSNCTIGDIYVETDATGWSGYGSGGANGHIDTPSIGIRCAGREFLITNRTIINADRGVHLRALTTAENTSIDHFTMEHMLISVGGKVKTTGLVTLSATATGYHRADGGSFVDDGFLPGMSIAGAGFGATSGNNGTPRSSRAALPNTVITAVTASDITCPGCTVEAAAANRSLTQVSTETAVLIDGDAAGGNPSFEGLSSNGGRYGVWKQYNGGASGSIATVNTSRIRYEQPAVYDGYSVRWEAQTTGITISDSGLGGPGNAGEDANGGAYLRNCIGVTFANDVYSGGAGWDGLTGTAAGTGIVSCAAGAAVFSRPQPASVMVAGMVVTVSLPWSVVSITRVSTTATATITAHGIPIGQSVSVMFAGATPADYNGTFVCTAATANTLTFAIGGAVATPATGTITAVGVPTYSVSAVADLQHATLTGAPTFASSTFGRTPMKEVLNVDATCDDIAFENAQFSDSATDNLIESGFFEYDGGPKRISAVHIAPFSKWSRGKVWREAGIPTDGVLMLLQPRAAYTLPMSAAGDVTTGWLETSAGWAVTPADSVTMTTGGVSSVTVTFSAEQIMAGVGTVTVAAGGAATFSQPQVGMTNGSLVRIGGTIYTVSAYNSSAQTATLAGAPVTAASAFDRNLIQIGDRLLSRPASVGYTVATVPNFTSVTLTAAATLTATAFTIGISCGGVFTVGAVGADKGWGVRAEVGDVNGGLGILFDNRGSIRILNTSLHPLRMIYKAHWAQ